MQLGSLTVEQLNVRGSDGKSERTLASMDSSGRINMPDVVPANVVYATAQLDKTSDAALADIAGLSLNLSAGGIYVIDGAIHLTSGISGGIKFGWAGGVTATAARWLLDAAKTGVATVTVSQTDITTASGSTAAFDHAYIEGYIQVNAGGVLKLQFAQNASNGTTSSVFVGSYLRATRVG